jgi:transposase
MDKLFAGIDVSRDSNAVFLMLQDGSKHSSFTVQNNLGGAHTLCQRIVSALSQRKLDTAVIGIEATSVYGETLMYSLREDGALAKFDRKLHVLNPKQVKKFKDIHPDLPKNDPVDAFVIADNLRFGRITREVYMDDYRYKALQTLTRTRFRAVNNLTREKQRFMNLLFLKCSGLAQERIFSDNYGVTALALFEQFQSPDELANMDLDELSAWLSKHGRNHFEHPENLAKAIQAAAKDSYRLPKLVGDSVNQALAISVSTMRMMQSHIKQLDKVIATQIAAIPNTLTSVPGIGPVYSAGIIAEVGDINRFNGQASLAKYAGLVWTEHQSGQFTAQNTRQIPSGNRFLKYYLCEAAASLARCDAEYKRFYDLKFNEVNKYQHKRALALTARKLVRLVFRLLKDNRLYSPAARG